MLYDSHLATYFTLRHYSFAELVVKQTFREFNIIVHSQDTGLAIVFKSFTFTRKSIHKPS